MQDLNVNSMAELLDLRDPDFPQVIVAGWMKSKNFEPMGAAWVKCDTTPSVGQMAVSYGACLAAILKRIQELSDSEPDIADSIWAVVDMIAPNLEVVAKVKNEMASPAALAGASA